MKIRMPEKKFYSISELASRWECHDADVVHLIEVGDLQRADKLAALHGKRRVYFGCYGYKRDPERPCFVPKPSEQWVKFWEAQAKPDELIQVFEIDGDFEGENAFRINMASKKLEAQLRRDNPQHFETVILLEDVLAFESVYAAQERLQVSSRAHASEKLAILEQAAQKFWSNADPNDPTTHTKNQDVVAWLVNHGYSQSLANSGASIIRPEWAATGRPQEK